MLRALTLMAAATTAALATNMNGDYAVSSVGDVDTNWNSDYASKGYEYFDVWAPEIATHYGEVFWTDQGTNPLPDHIIKRFNNSVIAIVGYEQDQVMVQPQGQPGLNPEKDVSVPINWAYNHHYCAWMIGKAVEMKERKTKEMFDGNTYATGAHGRETMMVPVPKPGAEPRQFEGVAQTSWFISEGNGGESRKSFHGYPKGMAQLIESPTSWHITPMQIDTRNREHGVGPESVHNCTDMDKCAGFEPRQARYGRNWAGLTERPPHVNGYSGILECPCNSRYGGDPLFYPKAGTKVLERAITAIPSGTCGNGKFPSAQNCYDAVANLGFGLKSVANKTASDATAPSGCVLVKEADGSATALFNTAASTAACADSDVKVATSVSPVNQVAVNVSLTKTEGHTMARSAKGEYCSQNKVGVLKEFPAKTTTSPADASAALAACETFCEASGACTACSVDMAGPTGMQWAAIPECGPLTKWAGSIPGDVSTKTVTGKATITLTGPADAWFAVGFGATEMHDQPYTIVASNTGVVERKLGTCGTEAQHCAGTVLNASVSLVSNSVAANVRTVVVTRPLTGPTTDYFDFTPAKVATLNYISAKGTSQAFGYHGVNNHDSLTMSFSPPTGATCVCDRGEVGKLCNTNSTGCNTFTKGCVAHSPTLGAKGEESGDLLSDRNPTCNSGSYVGGLSCCSHKRIMLDDDQIVPTELLRYHMKYRFWFQEYKPTPTKSPWNASHIDLTRIYFQTEGNAGEYDIPPAFRTAEQPKIAGYPDVGVYPELTPGSSCTGNCPSGDDCECVHTITFNITMGPTRLIYAGGHCHAPACIGIWLYRNDPGHEMELLCHQAPLYGNGTGTNSKSGMYDEKGYLSLPPCLWGEDKGLHPSVLLPAHTELVSVKKNRNTHMGHFGEMASWQMRGLDF